MFGIRSPSALAQAAYGEFCAAVRLTTYGALGILESWCVAVTNEDEAVPEKEGGSHRSGRWSRAAGEASRGASENRTPDRPVHGEDSPTARREDNRDSRDGGARGPIRSPGDNGRPGRSEDRRSGADFRRDSQRQDDRRRDGSAGRSYEPRERDRGSRGRSNDARRGDRPAYGRGPREDRRRDDRDGVSFDDRARGRGRSSGPRADGRDDRRGGRDARADQRDERSASADRAPRGPRSWDRSSPSQRSTRDTRVEPPLPDEITGKELDRSVWREMRTLTKENAQGVARHLVAAATLLEDDSDLALAHAEHAARRAGRVAAVREALGLVHYRRGEFNDAIREFRTAKRLSGSNHLLPYLVDCERGLGRYERALDLAASPEARSLGEADNIELAIVVSGVRRDLNQPEAAQMVLRIPALERASKQPWAARLFYAYAEALLAGGRDDDARDWFAKAIDADVEGQTDAAERVDDLDGLVFVDALDEESDESVPGEPKHGSYVSADQPAASADSTERTGSPREPDAAVSGDSDAVSGSVIFVDGSEGDQA